MEKQQRLQLTADRGGDFLISVIVPVYQVEKSLKRCVDSILSQTFSELEVILVDDGSTDESPQICDQYALADSRVRVLHKENGGLSSARNAGLDLAKGDYVGFVDSDDYIDKTMYQKLYNAITSADGDVAVCNCLQIDENGNALEGARYHYQLGREVLSGKEILNRIGDRGSAVYVVMWNKLYRRELFCGLRFDEGKINEDIRIFGKLYARVNRVSCIPERLYYYVRGNNSITREKISIRNLDHAEAFYVCFCFFAEQGMTELLAPTERRLFGVMTDVYYELSREDQKSERMKLTKQRQRRAVKVLLQYRQLSLWTLCRSVVFWITPKGYRFVFKIMRGESGNRKGNSHKKGD